MRFASLNSSRNTCMRERSVSSSSAMVNTTETLLALGTITLEMVGSDGAYMLSLEKKCMIFGCNPARLPDSSAWKYLWNGAPRVYCCSGATLRR